MTCYVPYDGRIKLDGYDVGLVYEHIDEYGNPRWWWSARVNGRGIDNYGASRRYAFAAAVRDCEQEAAVIR